MITRNFNLFLSAGRSVPLVINANQAEESEQWVFSLFQEDGTPYTPTDGSIVGIKSDGYLISNSGTVVDGKVVISETKQMTAAAGKAVFELRIDGLTHGTANFVVLVEEDPTNEGIVSDSDLSLIEEALSAVSPLPTGGSVGQVLTKTANGSAWSNAGTPTQEQVADAVSDWADEHITVETGVVIDTSLSVAGAAADSKKVGDEITDLKSAIAQSTGMSAEFKVALENLLSKVAYIDENGQTYVDALHTAMYPPANLVSISAVYTQSITVYDTDSLDVLRADLVVTANMSDETSETVTSYTLSGTLAEGTSEITVTYGGKTTTFNVTVTQHVDAFAYGLVDNSSAVTGSYITDTGEIETSTQQSGYYEDYIDLYGRSSVVIRYVPSAGAINYRISVYDANKVFTRQLRSTENAYETVTLQSGERYIRLGWYLGSTSYTCKFYIQSTSPTTLQMEVGDINGTTGENSSSTVRVRSVGYIPASGSITVEDCPWGTWATWTGGAGGGYFFRCYDASYNIVGTLIGANNTMYRADISQISLPTGTAYVRMVLQKTGSSTTISSGFTANTHPFAINGTSYQVAEA